MTHEPGTLDELEPALRAAGFTHVRTFGGPVSLADFDPYGCRRASSINRPPAHLLWRGRYVEHNGMPYLADDPPGGITPPFVGGLFPLLSEPQEAP